MPTTNTFSMRVRKAHKRDPLTPLVDRWLIERQQRPKPWVLQDEVPRPPGRFSPSNMECLRAGVFGFMGVPGKRVVSPELQLIFDTGDWLHWMWFSNFLAMQEHFGKEVFEVVDIEMRVVLPGLWMSGRFDVHVRIRGRDYLIDVKTINDAGFQGLGQYGVSKGYSDQLTRYMRARGIKRGLIFYFNKNDQRYKVYKLLFDKEQWRQSVKWLRRGQAHLKAGTVPPMHKDCEEGNKMAKDCPFRQFCYDTDKNELEALIYGGKPSAEELWEENN